MTATKRKSIRSQFSVSSGRSPRLPVIFLRSPDDHEGSPLRPCPMPHVRPSVVVHRPEIARSHVGSGLKLPVKVGYIIKS
jgi:hypothetical protein